MTASHHPQIVAHRGDPGRFPENTTASIRAALEAGLRAVEFDVQVTADGVPVVLHDSTLRRTAGVNASVFDLPADRVRAIEVGPGVTIPTLAEMVELLRSWTDAIAFVEIKRASLRRFGRETVVKNVLEVLRPVADHAVVISFDRDAVALARDRAGLGIGWVIEAWDDRVRAVADTLAPEYLFCEMSIAGDPLWPGPWRWVVYGVESVTDALAMAARGADLVETMAVRELAAALGPAS